MLNNRNVLISSKAFDQGLPSRFELHWQASLRILLSEFGIQDPLKHVSDLFYRVPFALLSPYFIELSAILELNQG